MKKAIITAMAATMALWAVPSEAAWTRWYNMQKKADQNELFGYMEQGTPRMPKQVQCKVSKGNLLVRVDFRSGVFVEGHYYLFINSKARVDAEFGKYKRRGASILSRQDVKTSRGMVSCIVWRKPS